MTDRERLRERGLAVAPDENVPMTSTELLALLADLEAAEERVRVLGDLDGLADDVRFAGGGGTSDYWRGFNAGIDKLVEHAALAATEEGAGT